MGRTTRAFWLFLLVFVACAGTDGSCDRCDGTDEECEPGDCWCRWRHEDPCHPGLDVRINEVMVNPEGQDLGQEWIELVNLSDDHADISGWSLEWYKSDPQSPSNDVDFPSDTVILSGRFLLIGGEEVEPSPDVEADLDLGNGQGGDGILLRDCQDQIIDAVPYSPPNDDWIVDETGESADSLAPLPGEDESIARCDPDGEGDDHDGYDTDDPELDFRVCEADLVTPRASNTDCCDRPTGQSADQVEVVINEAMVDPVGADAGAEWVELYNAGDGEADLTGWILEWYKSDPENPSGDIVLPVGTVLPAGEFLVIGGEDCAPSPDVIADLDLGNGSDGDGIHLRDAEEPPALEDALVYCPPNEDEIPDDSGGPAESLAPEPEHGDSLARCDPDGDDALHDGHDTDLSGDDFVLCLLEGGTPGETNADCCPAPCELADDVVIVINEALVNPDGSDADREWVELYNAGPGPVDLSGWTLEWYKSVPDSPSGSAEIPPDTVVDAGDFLVLLGWAVDPPDGDYAMVEVDLDLGNGQTGDGLHLRDCSPDLTLEDALVYAPPNDDQIVDESGLPATSVAPDASDDQTLARLPGAVDTDQSGEDFAVCDPENSTLGNENLDCR